jgi:hypothetical protein
MYINIYGYTRYYRLLRRARIRMSNYLHFNVLGTAYGTNNAQGGKKMRSGLSTGGEFFNGGLSRADDSGESQAFPHQTSGILAPWSATQRPIIVEMPRSKPRINDL